MAKAQIGTGRELPKMVVVRTGWMTYYAGSIAGDEQPVRGGAYNYRDVGHELFNFLDLDGTLHGYCQPAVSSNTLNLRRIDPQATTDRLEGVLVVFIATHPSGGQVVTGWYRNARVYRFPEKETDKRRSLNGGYFDFYFEAPTSEAVLLPPSERRLTIPTGAGSMGRTNVFYPYEQTGTQRDLLWLEQIVDFVDRYDDENLVQVTKGGLEEAAVKAAEVADTSWAGQGFLQASAIRQAIERRAMIVVERYLREHDQHVADHSASKPYDFLATKDGEELFVEVKGTQGDGSFVFLTPREVKWARQHHPCTALVVVTSIKVSIEQEKIEADGGELHVIQSWYPDHDSLTPLAYRFETGLADNS